MTEKDFYNIERFLSGEMTTEEHNAFLERLKHDAQLKEELEMEKSMRHHFNDLSDVIEKKASHPELTDQIQQAEQQYFDSIKKPKQSNLRKLYYWSGAAVAATVLLLLVNNIFFSSASPLELYQTYNDWNDIPSSIEMSDNNTSVENLENAFYLKEYQKVLSIYANNWDDFDSKTPSLLMVAIAYQEIEMPIRAIEIFDSIERSNAIDKSIAYWYKAMFYLKQEDSDKALIQLKKVLENPENFNYKKAEKLIKELNK